jgi:hypothetical protein
MELPFFRLAFSSKRRRLLTISNIFFNRWGFLYQFTHGRWVQSNLSGLSCGLIHLKAVLWLAIKTVVETCQCSKTITRLRGFLCQLIPEWWVESNWSVISCASDDVWSQNNCILWYMNFIKVISLPDTKGP